MQAEGVGQSENVQHSPNKEEMDARNQFSIQSSGLRVKQMAVGSGAIKGKGDQANSSSSLDNRLHSTQRNFMTGLQSPREEAYIMEDQGSFYLYQSGEAQNDFLNGKMNPFEFAKEIRQNMVADEEYIKVSEMGGMPDDQYRLVSGQRIGGNTIKMLYSSQKQQSPNVTMEFQRSARKSVQRDSPPFQSDTRAGQLNLNVSVDSGASQSAQESDIAKSTSSMSKCLSMYYRLSSLLFLAALMASIYFTSQSREMVATLKSKEIQLSEEAIFPRIFQLVQFFATGFLII